MTARTITTLEERWALPRGTVIRDAAGVAWVKRPVSWMATTPIEDDQWIGMPATVLHDPSAPAPAPNATREEVSLAIRSVTDRWDEPLDEVHDVPPVADALLALFTITPKEDR